MVQLFPPSDAVVKKFTATEMVFYVEHYRCMWHAKAGNSLTYARPPFTGSGLPGISLSSSCTSAARAEIFVSIPANQLFGISSVIIVMVSPLSHENVIGALPPVNEPAREGGGCQQQNSVPCFGTASLRERG